MGGTFDFNSQVGRGSTFWFEVPLPSTRLDTRGHEGPEREPS